MKKFVLLLIIAVVAGGSYTRAQETPAPERTVGGFGHFFIGPGLLQSKKINDYLKRSDVLGSGYSPSAIGYTVGGEGMAMLDRFIIGGGGFGYVVPTVSTDSGSAMTAFGGGYFKLGYKFCEKKNTFMYGYLAFGGSGYGMQLSNRADSVSLNFNHKYPVKPGKVENYAFGGFLFDFGVSLKTLTFGSTSTAPSHKKGGFMIGIDLGCTLSMPVTEWQSTVKVNDTHESVAVVGPPTPPATLSPYLRITIGGGGFKEIR